MHGGKWREEDILAIDCWHKKYALKETRTRSRISWTHSDALKVCWHLSLNAIIHLLVTIQSFKIQLGSND